ncbi:MAG TPA: hypothetical protein VJ853_07725 [Thermoanaerobaculia bacterium]|nr:hypothetical protein [Thermoanaerobaculia bacterium]
MASREQPYRPFTPLLIVLLFVSAWFAAICFVAARETIGFHALEIIAAAALALGAGDRYLR